VPSDQVQAARNHILRRLAHAAACHARGLFGELDGRPSQRGAAFDALCRAAGFDSTNTNDILVGLWEKFVLLAANSSVATLTRLPLGKLRDDPGVFGLFEKSVGEVAAWAAPAASAWPRMLRHGCCKPSAGSRRK
jgi:ketopantoate reductase